MRDYKKIEKTHLLSAYEIKIPNWSGTRAVRVPFSAWSTAGTLPWYDAYNTTKHDRHSRFDEATFDQMIDSVCGLLVILSAQFGRNDFSPGTPLLALQGSGDGMESGIGQYFRIKFPANWPADLRYEFDWQSLKAEPDPFQTIDYSRIV